MHATINTQRKDYLVDITELFITKHSISAVTYATNVLGGFHKLMDLACYFAVNNIKIQDLDEFNNNVKNMMQFTNDELVKKVVFDLANLLSIKLLPHLRMSYPNFQLHVSIIDAWHDYGETKVSEKMFVTANLTVSLQLIHSTKGEENAVAG